MTMKKTEAEKPICETVAELCEKVAYDRKAENILRIDMREFSAESELFILCTGLSEPHIGAISERVQREVRTDLGIRPVAVDGTPASHWIIVDFGCVMMHILTNEARSKYQLESLWNDAPKTDAYARLEEEAKRRFAKQQAEAGEK